MRRTERDRRDWSLLIFVVPLGILLMLLAGQLAMRIIPWWILNANMGSTLSLDGQAAPIPLFNMQILTPFAWQDTYLTPSVGDGFVYPPFIVIEPSVVVGTLPPKTDVPRTTSTPPAPIPTTTLQRSTATLPPPLKTATRNPTNNPATETKVAGFTATNTLTQTSTATPTGTSTVTQTGTATATPTGTGTPTQTGTATATSTATPTKSPTPVPTGYPSTIDPGLTGPLPIDLTGPDGNVDPIPQGSYAVVDLGANPVMVYGTLDVNYEIVFYEVEGANPGFIYLDNIIFGITNDPLGQTFYKVFDWGDGITDFNSNVSGWPEIDNQEISMASLYNGTGILIDADNAASEPPPIINGYRYLVIIAPVKPPPNPNPGETIDVDAIEIFP